MSVHSRRARSAARDGLLAVLLAGSTAVARPHPVAPTPAPQDLPERVLEKTDGDYSLRITLRPGNLQPDRVADVSVVLVRNLDIPDPVTGNIMPLPNAHPIATIHSPQEAPRRGHPAPEPTTTRYALWGDPNEPGTFAFHFTPPEDGVYQLTIAGTDPGKSGGDDATGPQTFQATYRIGVGTAAAQTEQTQDTSGYVADRRPVGATDAFASEKKLKALMSEIGYRYVELEDMLNRPTRRGDDAAGDFADAARAISRLLAQAKGLMPDGFSSTREFDGLAMSSAASFDQVANADDRSSARDAFSGLESTSCDECHARYRFQITDDLSRWPTFAQKAVSP